MKGVKSIGSVEKGDLLVAISTVQAKGISGNVTYQAGQKMGQVLSVSADSVSFSGGAGFGGFLPTYSVLLSYFKGPVYGIKWTVNPDYNYPDKATTTNTGTKWWETVLQVIGTVVPILIPKNGESPVNNENPNGQYDANEESATAKVEREKAELAEKQKQRRTVLIVVGVVVLIVGGVLILVFRKKKAKTV